MNSRSNHMGPAVVESLLETFHGPGQHIGFYRIESACGRRRPEAVVALMEGNPCVATSRRRQETERQDAVGRVIPY